MYVSLLPFPSDKLYVLDYDLQEVESSSWEPEQSKKTSCDNSNEDTQVAIHALYAHCVLYSIDDVSLSEYTYVCTC